MKKIFFSVLGLLFAVFTLISCDEKYTDLMTSDVKTGGLIYPTEAVPYKLGSTPSFTITIDIPKGPGVESIEIYRKYTEYDSDGSVKTVKGPVLHSTVNVGSANVSEDSSVDVNMTYSNLIAGLSMPTDESVLTIGDGWTLNYTAVMEDGRKVESATPTTIAVANFFAGSYEKTIKYFHPTAGGSYPTTPYSAYEENVNLVALNASECTDFFGVWEDNIVTIHINPDNTVTLAFDRPDAVSGDPNNPANVNSYDPATGVIKIYYFYPGSGGNRIFWAVYTPR